MYILFTKEHSAGISEGAYKKLSAGVAQRFIDEGYAKEITEKEYNELKGGVVKKRKARAKKTQEVAVKKATKRNAAQKKAEEDAKNYVPRKESGCADCDKKAEPCDDCKEEKEDK